MNLNNFIRFCDDNLVEYKTNEPLAEYTSFKIGGICKMLLFPKSIEEVGVLIKKIHEFNIRYFILGNGSNILFSDDGFDGVVIYLPKNLVNIELVDSNKILCYSGASLYDVCEFALKNNLTGLEFAYGIPGSVGGATYMNAGAYGGEIKDVVQNVYYIDSSGEEKKFDKSELDFSYRHSIFTDNNYIITKTVFSLEQGEHEQINAKMQELLGKRKDKQPLEYPSAGSTFKRPVGGYASALIDQCGLKGKRIGGAEVSSKHAGFVINADNATCSDVLNLVKFIQDKVLEKTGISLECEVKVIK